MCVVSNVGDDWTRKLPEQWPNYIPTTAPRPNTGLLPMPVDPAEFQALKKQVEQMRKELEAAKAQDIAEGNPDCEMEEKVALLKAVAKALGVDLSSVWPEE